MIEYNELFTRNIGLLTKEEQEKIKNTHISIAGLGGVGGAQIIALTRLGINNFTITDPESFDETNINRQYGATTKTIGKNKAEVTKQLIQDINPNANIKIIPMLTNQNIDEFIKDSDIIIDAIEYFEFEIKIKLYEKSREYNKPVFTSPIPGYSPSLIIFHPQGTTFEELTGISYSNTNEQNAKLLMKKLLPEIPNYLTPNPYDEKLLGKTSFPTISFSSFASAAMLSAEIMFYITNKKTLHYAPKIQVLDLFEQTYKIIESKNAK